MSEHRPEVLEISRNELLEKRRRGDAFILVDVLPHEHYLRAHIPGAVNVPLILLHELAPLLFSPLDEIIVYCSNVHCTISTTAVRVLKQHGFTYVFDYKGGIMDWEDGGQTVIHVLPPEQAEAA